MKLTNVIAESSEHLVPGANRSAARGFALLRLQREMDVWSRRARGAKAAANMKAARAAEIEASNG